MQRLAARSLLALVVGIGGGCDGCDVAPRDDGGLVDDGGDAPGGDAGRVEDDDDAGSGGSDAGTDDDDDGGGRDGDAGRMDDDAGGAIGDGGPTGADGGSTGSDGGGSTGSDGGSTGSDGGSTGADGGNGTSDGGPVGGATDAGTSSPCLAGPSGTHVARFRWNGTTSGSTAWVSYEANTLPDTSRWKAGAYSQSFGYTPTFRDPFLGEGGLDLSGTAFIDVELSTAGLSSVSTAWLAIYGRSFHTTSSGSFSWQTFSDQGATPSGFVSNSAPYEWYVADVTSALPAGDDGTLLRIRAGPPSGALIVSRVELCFDAQ